MNSTTISAHGSELSWPVIRSALNMMDYVRILFEDFHELHGDRAYGDDPAMIAGFAKYHGRPVALIGQQKGRDTKQRVALNFGQAKPEGYRKACA